MTDTISAIKVWLLAYGPDLILALVILVVGIKLAGSLSRIIQRLMKKGNLDPSLVSFLGSLSRWLLITFVVIAALERVGFETSSLVAVLGAATLAVALSLKDQLSNLAAGVLLLIFRPFRLGETIEGAGVLGTVEEISILTTRLKTPDGKVVIVPNGKLTGDTITNVSRNPHRRIDMVIGIGYDDDLPKAKRVLEEILAAEPRVLDDPAPRVMVSELADSSVNLAVRPWVRQEDWWSTRCHLLETIKLRLDAEGISIPYPQQDVHLYRQAQPKAQ